MPSEQQQDGHVLYDPAAPPQGRLRRLIHVNGMASTVDKQHRDLQALGRMVENHPVDVIGVHNSTEGFQADILESVVGRAELWQWWPNQQSPTSQQRLQGYADLLNRVSTQELSSDVDILEAIQQQQRSQQGASQLSSIVPLGLDLVRRLPFAKTMSWDELESYLYGKYPPGAPRPTLRLAYEVVKAMRAGADVSIVAHSQGTIIAALALQIVQRLFETYTKWAESVYFIGYGPVILFEDLPPHLRSQTVMIQHRQDVVAESFSNLRTVDLWQTVQVQAKNLIERADSIFELVNQDSHHSASLYLGLTGNAVGDRSAQLLKLLLTENWNTHPFVKALRSSRIILEAPASALTAPQTR